MKLFASCVSKFNVLIALWALGATTLSFPGTAMFIGSEGNNYHPRMLQGAAKSVGADSYLNLSLAQGAKYTEIIDFADMSNSISKVMLLQSNRGKGSETAMKCYATTLNV
ncbi:hypothetical protein [Aliterella atlantica]|uniref:Uncharacterized protein n=1 Tax=Aliterella atlantica CENA595 TaxID=1618023 RepID=A0A0D8ZPM5_9CYAN|nr:hypothetical protein [Aliterella atlantica]KJH70292.1 hypothetical protein UH38_19320 [Aliterella atlantica CENA595]